MYLTELKAKCWQSCAPSVDTKGESIPLTFYLLEAGPLPWLVAPFYSENQQWPVESFSI